MDFAVSCVRVAFHSAWTNCGVLCKWNKSVLGLGSLDSIRGDPMGSKKNWLLRNFRQSVPVQVDGGSSV